MTILIWISTYNTRTIASFDCKCGSSDDRGVECTFQSEVFNRAILESYFGEDPVSPSAKASVLAGIKEQ